MRKRRRLARWSRDVLITEAGGDSERRLREQADARPRRAHEHGRTRLCRAPWRPRRPRSQRRSMQSPSALRAGGRLIYVGAGSSGRIAALDASECEATFSTPPGMVVALVAGGESAPALVQAAAEDDRDTGAADVEALSIGAADAVVGMSASGSTPYVLGALEAAGTQVRSRRVSCATPGSKLGVDRRARDRSSSSAPSSSRGRPGSKPAPRRSSCSTRSRRSR